MNSYLERLQRELEQATGKARESDLMRAPQGKWSTAQILEHLFLTYKHTNRGLEKCLQQGAPLATRGNFKDRVATFVVVRLGYLPGGRKAPERALPQGIPVEQVRIAIVPELVKMGAILDDCERRFGAGTKILDHPILGPLTAYEWRKFHWLHGRHHARQMRERMLGDPA